MEKNTLNDPKNAQIWELNIYVSNNRYVTVSGEDD